MNLLGTHQCPLPRCRKPFGLRSDAIVHFKRTHAGKSTLCPICLKPILIQRIYDAKRHFSRYHPTVDASLHFINPKKKKKQVNDKQPNVALQTKRIQNKSLSQPAKEVHEEEQPLSCPLKHCNYETMQMTELCAHWTRKHGDLEFPQYRENKFTYTDDSPTTSVDRKVILIDLIDRKKLLVI